MFSVSLPLFGLSATLLATWIKPMSVDNGHWVKFGVAIMCLEFVLVHSSGMFASWQQKRGPADWKAFLGLLVLYSVFAGGMALSFASWELFGIFVMVMLSRSISMVTDSGHANKIAMDRMSYSIVFYLLAVMLSIFLPIPPLGIDSTVMFQVYSDAGGGEWERHPERALFAGVLYFVLMGITEIVSIYKRPME